MTDDAFVFDLKRKRIDAISEDIVLADLRLVAEHYGGRRFTKKEFDAVATRCSGGTVLRQFPTWDDALRAIGRELSPRKVDRSQISEQDLLAELGRVWKALGHRPSKTEWNAFDVKYSYNTDKRRFQGWTQACVAFVENVSTVADAPVDKTMSPNPPSRTRIPADGRRDAPVSLRYKVLQRDNYKCVLCGRTPALNPGVTLHVDHIQPFVDGGPTVLENLRVLCSDCNLGKGRSAP